MEKNVGIETIEVFYEPVKVIPGTTLGGYHETLLYTNSEGVQFISTCGPSGKGAGDASTFISQAGSAAATGIETDWGTLTCNFNPVSSSGFSTVELNNLIGPANQRQTVASGEDLSSAWDKIGQVDAAIIASGLFYSPLTLNSNSAVSTELSAAGIPPPSNNGFFGGHWTPGSENIIQTPFTAAVTGDTVSQTTDYQGNTQYVITNNSTLGPSGEVDNFVFTPATGTVALFESQDGSGIGEENGYYFTPPPDYYTSPPYSPPDYYTSPPYSPPDYYTSPPYSPPDYYTSPPYTPPDYSFSPYSSPSDSFGGWSKALGISRAGADDGGFSQARVSADGQLDQLIQAMAVFAPPAAGQTTLPPDYQTGLSPVIAADWR